MSFKPFHNRWLRYLIGMVAFALLASALFPAPESASAPAALPNTEQGITPIAQETIEEAPANTLNALLSATGRESLFDGAYELNFGAQWLTSNVTSMYNGQWFTEPMTYSMVTDAVSGDTLPMFEGDIVLNLNSVTGAGSAVNRTSLLWPGGVVAWDIVATMPAQYRIFDAIEHWEEYTKIRFVERTAANAKQYPNYIHFQPAAGCWSYVGMQGGAQPIGLALGCGTGSTIHEIGHALGVWHEQSRIDRDEHITVYFENIVNGMQHNFAKHTTDGQDVGEYDYLSIMHYPRWAFSKNGKDTIVPKTEVEIGQRTTLSPGDIATIEFLYGK